MGNCYSAQGINEREYLTATEQMIYPAFMVEPNITEGRVALIKESWGMVVEGSLPEFENFKKQATKCGAEPYAAVFFCKLICSFSKKFQRATEI